MPLPSARAKTETLNLKLVPIGNSVGVRLSRPLLAKYGMEHSVVAEQRPDGLLLRGAVQAKATLEQTFIEMAKEATAQKRSGQPVTENWQDFDAASADGLDKLVW